MTGTWRHPGKFLEDGSLNPAWKPHSKPGVPHNKPGRPHRRSDLITEDGLHYSDTLFRAGRFVAFDGESIRIGKQDQEYVMLCASNGEKDYSLVKSGNKPLSGFEFLDFLCSVVADNPRSIYVGFAFQYDVDMILKNLINYEQGKALWEGDKAVIRGPEWNYHISLIAKKRFNVQRFPKRGNSKPESSFVIYDSFGFYQSTFVKALEDNLGKNYEGIKLIAEGKALRNSFAGDDFEFMEKYCKLECRALVDLMKFLRNALEAAGIEITNWYGAGAVAAALMKREGVKQHIVPIENPAVLDACKRAFFGGRIELFKIGHHEGTIYNYDINSAYPNAARFLPPMDHGEWRPIAPGHISTEPLSVYHIRYMAGYDLRPQHLIPPFPCRYKALNVRYVEPVETWVWWPELGAFLRNNPYSTELQILGGWEWSGYTPFSSPFGFVPLLFEQRKIWKEQGNGAQLPLKLGLNSLYGKMIQRVGGGIDRAERFEARTQGRKELRNRPAYFSLPYAGFITSYTRAMLYEAAMQKPEAIIMMMTDGIYSLEPLDLPLGDKLGEWSLTEYSGGTFVQAGVYWLDGGDSERTEVAHYRGYDKGSIVRESVLRTWHEDHIRLTNGKKPYPRVSSHTVSAASSRHIGLGAAVVSERTWGKFCKWPTLKRELNVYRNEKRYADNDVVAQNDLSCTLATLKQREAWPSMLGFGLVVPESWPYNVNWLGDPDFTRDELVDGVPWRIGEDEYNYGRE